MNHIFNNYLVLLYFFSVISGITMIETDKKSKQIFEQATFGAGCFWCVEAIFERLEGVVDVRAGYTGGKIESPTYDDVCSGETGHVEVVRVDFNPQIIGFKQIFQIIHINTPRSIYIKIVHLHSLFFQLSTGIKN